MPRPPDPSARRRILDVATQLFAERGYAGTTTRAIAAAVGANISTVHYHVGSKLDLFSAVLEELYEEESVVLSQRLKPLEAGTIRDTDQVIDVLVDTASALIDLMASRPERPRLYLRRWLDPPDQLRGLEVRISLQLHRRLKRLLERAKGSGAIHAALPVETFLRSFTWMIYGYFATGPIDWKHWFSDPLDPAHLRDLRRLVRQHVRQTLSANWS